MASRLTLVGQRVVLRTSRGPLRPLWALLYGAVLRSLAAYLRRGGRDVTAYACGSFGSGEPVYGVSDLDLVIVAADEEGAPGVQRARIVRRCERLRRALPLLEELIDVAVYEQAGLSRSVAGCALTYGLDTDGVNGESVYFGEQARTASVALHEGPGLYGPTHGWRRLSGRERLPAPPAENVQRRRIAAWLQLQSWWRWTFAASTSSGGPRAPYMCVKLISEPARIWLWLTTGERTGSRRETLERALRSIPEEEEAIRRALSLHAALARSPSPPFSELLPAFVRLSARIAQRLADELAPAGATPVLLVRDGGGDIALSASASDRLRLLGRSESDLLPLADWRARTYPWFTDEAFLPLDRDPGDVSALRKAAAFSEAGIYAAMRFGDLLVLPTLQLAAGRGRLRAVQCPVTDPVSFALWSGTDAARFPVAFGLSARDCSLRAVAEHRACLAELDIASSADPLAELFNAGRAALFHESLEDGEPRLALTVATGARLLADRLPRMRATVEDAYAGYTDSRLARRAPDPRTVAGLERVVRRLPAYAHR